jgi:signal transduction histidine kinase
MKFQILFGKNVRLLQYVFMVLILCFSYLFAQEEDSLETKLKKLDSRGKAQLFNSYAKLYLQREPPKARLYADRAIEIASVKKYLLEEALAEKLIGISFYYEGSYQEALKHYGTAADYFEQAGDKKQVANIFNNIGIVYEYIGQYDKSLEAHYRGLELRRELKDPYDIAISQLNIGTLYDAKDDHVKALEFYNYSLEYAVKSENDYLLLNLYNNFGVTYKSVCDYAKSIDYYLRALPIGEKLNDEKTVLSVLSNIGVVYLTWESYKKALGYFINALDKANSINDKRTIAKLHGNIGTAYLALNDLDKALENNLLSLKYLEELDDKQAVSITLEEIGNIYFKKKDYHKAYDLFESAFRIVEEINNPSRKINLYYRFGEIYGAENQPEISKEYFEKGFSLAQQQNDIDKQKEGCLLLSGCYDNKSDYKNALDYFKRYVTLKESIFNRESNETISNLQIKYETDKKQKEIELLNADKRNKELEIIRQQQDLSILNRDREIQQLELNRRYKEIQILGQDKKINELELAKRLSENEKAKEQILLLGKIKQLEEIKAGNRKTIIYFISVVAFLISIVTVVLFNRYSIKKKANVTLNKFNAELSRSNEMLVKSESELKNANDTKDKFISIIAHDLKNPVGIVKSLSEMLQNNYSSLNDEQKFVLIKNIRSSFTLADNLLQNLLQWALTQKNMITFSPKQVELSTIIKENVSVVLPGASAKNISVVFQNGQKHFISADINMINMIIRNILTNAVKFSNPGGEVKIKINKEESFTTINIADEGIGMSKNDLEKLFRIDIKNSEIGSSKEKGTGLGLILSNEFVKMHGGKINVESKPGHGTIVSVSLPS